MGGVATFATSVAASPFFPVGLGRRIDPDVGLHLHLGYVLPAVAVAVVLMVCGVALVAWRAAGLARHDGSAHPPPGLVLAVRRQTPVPVGLGTTMAFDPGTGRRRVPVRPALAASMVGVIGVVATLTINDGINDALAHPERAGVVADLEISPTGADPAASPTDEWVARVIAAAGPGAAVAQQSRAVVPVDGVGVQTLAMSPAGSGGGTAPAIQLTVIEGRSPGQPGEAAIGPKTARDRSLRVGDTIAVDGIATPLRLVGITLFPPEVHVGFDEGVLVHPDDFELLASAVKADNVVERWLAVDFPDDADIEQAAVAIDVALAGSAQITFVETPIELSNLRNIRTLPIVLAGFLGLLAVSSLALVFAISVRRRSRDFAILRALGLGRQSVHMVLNSQGTAIAAFGLLLGVPLGILVGRQGWKWIAGRVPLEYVAPFTAVAILISVPVAVLVANTLALWPGRRVATMRLVDQLRVE